MTTLPATPAEIRATLADLAIASGLLLAFGDLSGIHQGDAQRASLAIDNFVEGLLRIESNETQAARVGRALVGGGSPWL